MKYQTREDLAECLKGKERMEVEAWEIKDLFLAPESKTEFWLGPALDEDALRQFSNDLGFDIQLDFVIRTNSKCVFSKR